MANRLYVYASNRLPGENDTFKKIGAVGITESDYSMDLAICCFCNKYIKETSSLSWSGGISHCFDYKEGIKLFAKVFDKVVELNLHPDVDNRKVADGFKFLLKQKKNFFILESIEVVEMQGNLNSDKYSDDLEYLKALTPYVRNYVKNNVMKPSQILKKIMENKQGFFSKSIDTQLKDFCKRYFPDSEYIDFYLS